MPEPSLPSSLPISSKLCCVRWHLLEEAFDVSRRDHSQTGPGSEKQMTSIRKCFVSDFLAQAGFLSSLPGIFSSGANRHTRPKSNCVQPPRGEASGNAAIDKKSLDYYLMHTSSRRETRKQDLSLAWSIVLLVAVRLIYILPAKQLQHILCVFLRRSRQEGNLRLLLKRTLRKAHKGSPTPPHRCLASIPFLS